MQALIWVAGLIIKDNNILLLYRENTGFGDGFWSIPGGKIDANEDPSIAIKREILEEIGIEAEFDFSSVIHYTDFASHDKKYDQTKIIDLMGLFFISSKWTGSVENKEPHKHSDLKWFSLNSLPNNLLPIGKIAISLYLENKHYKEAGLVHNSPLRSI